MRVPNFLDFVNPIVLLHCGSIYVRDGLVDRTMLTMSILSLFSSELRRFVGCSRHDSIAGGLERS